MRARMRMQLSRFTTPRPAKFSPSALSNVPLAALVLLGGWAGSAPHAFAADKAVAKASAKETSADDPTKEEFRTVKREIQSRLRNKQVFERITALRDVGKYPRSTRPSSSLASA